MRILKEKISKWGFGLVLYISVLLFGLLCFVDHAQINIICCAPELFNSSKYCSNKMCIEDKVLDFS